MKFDDAVALIGDFGPYQKRVYFLLGLTSLSGCMQLLISVFTMAVPDHRCAIPGLDNDTWQVQSVHHAILINTSIPPGHSTAYSSCYVYADTYTSDPDNSTLPREVEGDLYVSEGYGLEDDEESAEALVRINRTTRPVRACSRYVYDTSTFKTTVVSQMDLVCEKKMGRSYAQTATMIGYLSGSAISSIPSDLFGRKRVMLFAVALHIATALSLAWVPYLPLLCVMCWLNGTSVMGLYTNAYVIGVELVGPTKRMMLGVGIVVFWCLGMMMLTPFAYFIRYWKTLQMAVSAMPVFFLSYYWLIPESPRWLLRKGRVLEAESILRQAARVNGVEKKLPPVLFDEQPLEESRGESVLVLRHHPRLMIKYLFIVYIWFVSSLTFYGLNLNIGNLSGNVYINFLLSGIMELVSYILCILLLDRVGRRPLNSALMLLAGLTCTATIFSVLYAPQSLQWITVALAMVGKLGIAGAFAIIWIYSSELFPTVIRNSGMGTSSVCAGLGGVLAPYIANMTHALGGGRALAVPLAIFGVSAIIAGLLLLLLPETLNRRLPETIEDGLVLFRIKSSPKLEDDLYYKYEMEAENERSTNKEEQVKFVRREEGDNFQQNKDESVLS